MPSVFNLWLIVCTHEPSLHATVQNKTDTDKHTHSLDMLLCLDKEIYEGKGHNVTYDKGQHHTNTSACLPRALQLEVSERQRGNSKCTKTVSVEVTEVIH